MAPVSVVCGGIRGSSSISCRTFMAPVSRVVCGSSICPSMAPVVVVACGSSICRCRPVALAGSHLYYYTVVLAISCQIGFYFCISPNIDR